MSDEKGRAAFHQALQRLENQAFRLGVQRAGGLVQNQNRRVLQQRPRNRDALAFAAGQRRAALADDRIVALGQTRNELVHVGSAGGVFNFGTRGGRPAISNVFGNRQRKQKRLLQYNGDLVPQTPQLHI